MSERSDIPDISDLSEFFRILLIYPKLNESHNRRIKKDIASGQEKHYQDDI
jgi:hypothetical protein